MGSLVKHTCFCLCLCMPTHWHLSQCDPHTLAPPHKLRRRLHLDAKPERDMATRFPYNGRLLRSAAVVSTTSSAVRPRCEARALAKNSSLSSNLHLHPAVLDRASAIRRNIRSTVFGALSFQACDIHTHRLQLRALAYWMPGPEGRVKYAMLTTKPPIIDAAKPTIGGGDVTSWTAKAWACHRSVTRKALLVAKPR